MKKTKAISKIVQGEGSDYYFKFCRIKDGHIEFGIEQNFNEYITLSYNDKDYVKKLGKTLEKIEKEDPYFYKNIKKLFN